MYDNKFNNFLSLFQVSTELTAHVAVFGNLILNAAIDG